MSSKKRNKLAALLTSLLILCGAFAGPHAWAQESPVAHRDAAIGADRPPPLPQQWTVYAGDREHDSTFQPAPGSALARLSGKIAWRFKEAGALPLTDEYGKDSAVLGPRSAPVKTTQFLGNAVGVSVVGDVLYAESDAGVVYALDAATGQPLWSTKVDNAAMGDPLVVDGRVFIGTGDTGFSFAEVLKAQAGAANHKNISRVRGLAWSAVYALDAKTGKVLWRYGTHGEDMPSECYGRNTLYFGNGDGHIYALDPASAHTRWVTFVGGFDSMSSCNIYDGKVIAGFTDPNELVAVDMQNGHVDWKTTFPNIANTGMGDNSPTIDVKDGLVIQVAIANARTVNGSTTVDTAVLAVDPARGKVAWRVLLGRGKSPPAYKASVAMVHDGRIYVSSPATNKLYAFAGATGRVLWASSIPHPEAPGLGRGAVTYHGGSLFQATGTSLYAWSATTGRLLASTKIGGRFGIDNPVIVGDTVFLSNSWGWLMALPISALFSGQPHS